MAAESLTRLKNSYLSSSTLESLSLFVLEGLKTEVGREPSALSAPPARLTSLLFYLSGWYFPGPHRNSSVTACAVDGGWVGGVVD